MLDAVRLIRRDNPMPTTCAYICEHPCENRCKRTIIDAPVNIRGLKKMAVDNSGIVPVPECEAPDRQEGCYYRWRTGWS